MSTTDDLIPRAIVDEVAPLNFVDVIKRSDNCCVIVAVKNYLMSQRRGRLIVGSLGVGLRDPWFEFGGKDWTTTSQFRTVKWGVKLWDCHVWYELVDDTIYDVVTDNVVVVAQQHGREVRLAPLTVVGGRSRVWWMQQGFWYKPAPAEIQEELLRAVMATAVEGIAGRRVLRSM